MKKKTGTFFLTMALICLLLLQGCGSNNQSREAEVYEFSELCFRMEFPTAWSGNYTVGKNPANEEQFNTYNEMRNGLYRVKFDIPEA